jgi:uncharacterized protein YbaA (DUF1428 family)
MSRRLGVASPLRDLMKEPRMPQYVDGFVLPVPTKNLAAYKKLAKKAAKIWLEHGALEYRECVGEDLNMPFGRTFPKLVKPRNGETIVFSWITYKSRAHRDRVNAAVMKDPRMMKDCDPSNMPFDVKRMSWGGFNTLVEA